MGPLNVNQSLQAENDEHEGEEMIGISAAPDQIIEMHDLSNKTKIDQYHQSIKDKASKEVSSNSEVA